MIICTLLSVPGTLWNDALFEVTASNFMFIMQLPCGTWPIWMICCRDELRGPDSAFLHWSDFMLLFDVSPCHRVFVSTIQCPTGLGMKESEQRC